MPFCSFLQKAGDSREQKKRRQSFTYCLFFVDGENLLLPDIKNVTLSGGSFCYNGIRTIGQALQVDANFAAAGASEIKSAVF